MNNTSFKFIGINELKEEAFLLHPIWVMYEDPEQDKEILSWGINLEKAWKNKIVNTEEEYYFPYLGNEELALTRGIYIYCKILLSSGHKLFGYLTGGFAFSIFAKDSKYKFNINMPQHGKETIQQLASTMGLQLDQIFPISFHLETNLHKKTIIYEQYW